MNRIFIKKESYDGIILPLTAFLGLFLPFLVPNAVSLFIKPIGIVAGVFWLIKSNQDIFRNKGLFFFLFFFGIYVCACLRFRNTLNVNSVGYLIYVVYALCLVTIDHSKKSIDRLIKGCFWAGALFALFVAVSNPFMSFNFYTRTRLLVLWQWINSNQIVYVVVIGFAAFPYLMHQLYLSKAKKLVYNLLLIPMAYCVFMTLSRGGFACLLSISVVYFLHLEWRNIKNNKVAFLGSLLLVIAAGFTLVDLFSFEYAQQLNRVISLESYEDSNGRMDMFSQAFSSVENIVIGGGCDAWNGGHKIHNIFISIFVQCGLLGLTAFVILFLFDIVRIRSIYAIYFAIPLIMQSMVESGDSYTFWIPFVVIWLINENKGNLKL